MKLIKIVGHPIVVIVTFLFILVSGKAFGGPYFIYLLLALPHGADYAVLGFLGILGLLISYAVYRSQTKRWLKPALALLSVTVLLYSLSVFFREERMRYNQGTFEQSIPIASIIIFFICALCGMIINVVDLVNSHLKDSSTSVDSFKSA